MSARKHRIRLLQLGFIPIIAAIVLVRPRWGLESTTAFVVESIGYFFLLAGLGVRVWAILYIGGRKSQEVVDEGPYSLCRNPLYFGTTLLAIGVGLCFENIVVLVAAAVLLLPTHYITARAEESNLLAKFPDSYATYMSRTPRFWPRLSLYRSASTVTVSTRAIRRVMVDTMGVLLIPQIEDLLEILHTHEIIPVLWYCP